jgi:hypothetical protein
LNTGGSRKRFREFSTQRKPSRLRGAGGTGRADREGRGLKSKRFPTKWAKAHNVKSKDLAEMLGITPQGMTEIFKGRNQPTGEQVLVMLELLRLDDKRISGDLMQAMCRKKKGPPASGSQTGEVTAVNAVAG